jgi:serralysin
VTEGDKAYMSAETNQYTNANQIARYEVALQQDLNQTGYVEYGELISGNLIGNGLWYDGSGYWIGRAQEKPSSYLVDPTKTFNLPGTPIKLVSPADNIENSQYQGVLFKQGINEFYLWSIDQNNRKVSSAIANGGISNPGILDESSLAHYERLFNEDFNQDGFKGLVKIIDSNSGKDDYTTLGEFIEPQDFDPHTRVSYFVRDPQLKVNTTYKYNNNESPFGPVKGYSVPSFILKSIRNTPIGYYKYDDGSEFNTSSSMPGQGWRAIAASFIPTETKIVKATFGTVEVPLFGEITVISEGFVDVMWKSPDENNPRWFIWRFEMAAPNNYYSPSSTTTFGNDIFYQPPILDAEAADTTDNNKAEYLNTISEVAVYESQFSEDFNQDGFIGTTTLLEQKGDVTLALVGYTPKPIFDDSSIIQPETLFTYQLKETTQSRGKNITINVRGGTITSSSSWQPLAAERYLINGPELEKGAYFSVLGKNTNTNTYSIFLLDEFANKMNDVPEQVISGADISIYEAQFQQDFNQDGAIYQHKIVDSEGAVLLGSSQNGYVIDELAKKQYLKLNNGSVLTEAVASDSGNVPFLIDKIATGYALLQKGTNGATYQRAKVDSTGKITDTRAIFFEPYRYIASNPDLIVAFATNTIAAQDHYLRAGYLEDRSTTGFDGLRYLASNPDLIFAGLRDERNGETHWINHGFYEGRSTSSFDAIQYLASYGDLIADYGYNLTQAIVHYINYGIFEGRSTDGFNEARYLASNPDLVRAGILGATDAANHWINDGFREGRALNRFNEADYLASYDDLLSSFGTNSDAAFGHWLSNGIQEGRTITFNPARYIASYPDLIQAFGYDLDAGRQHYISIGQSETRGRGIFDPESYLFFNSDLKELFVNDLESATKHYINFGWQEGRKW